MGISFVSLFYRQFLSSLIIKGKHRMEKQKANQRQKNIIIQISLVIIIYWKRIRYRLIDYHFKIPETG